MNFSHLQYFRAVAEEEHISRAAEKLLISQPSLSATIRRIEEELDTTLFDRKGRNIYLNENGRRLLDHVNYIFSQVDSLEQRMTNINFKISHNLTMAVNNCMYLDNWLSKFIVANENASISQVMMSEKQMLSDLLDEEIDIAIGDFPEIPSGIAHHTIVADEYIIVLPADHPLAQRESVYFDDIRHEPFVALAVNENYRIADKMFAKKASTPDIIFEGQQTMMFDVLKQGRGLLFASRQMIYMRGTQNTKVVAPNIKTVEVCLLPIIDMDTSFNLTVCWKADRKLPIMANNIVQAFIKKYPRFTSDASYCGKKVIELAY